jgi:hypothetical protein
MHASGGPASTIAPPLGVRGATICRNVRTAPHRIALPELHLTAIRLSKMFVLDRRDRLTECTDN